MSSDRIHRRVLLRAAAVMLALPWLDRMLPSGLCGETSSAETSSAATRAGQAAEAADWPTYNHDSAGWRFNPAEKTLSPANVGKLIERWRFPAADSNETIGVVHATPTVVAEEVYFGTVRSAAFYKLGPDGTQRWVYRVPPRKAVPPPIEGNPMSQKLLAAATWEGIYCWAPCPMAPCILQTWEA